jgi:serine protease Do
MASNRSTIRRPSCDTSHGYAKEPVMIRTSLVTAACLLSSLPVARASTDPAAPAGDVKAGINRARASVFLVESSDDGRPTGLRVSSAVAIDSDGHLLTIGLRQPADRTLRVRDMAGKRHEARWIAADGETGITLLKTSADVVRAPSLVDDAPTIGAPVIVVGNPFGLHHSVSVGNISGVGRSVGAATGGARGLIQFTAPVYPGDSGGLLADDEGRMVGIISTTLREPGEPDAPRVPGIGFAIPAAEVRWIAQRLRDGEEVRRGYLGVRGEDADGGGVRITGVAEGSPAESTGLRADDVIQSIDEKAVADFHDLAAHVERIQPGTKVKLGVARDGKARDLEVVIAERPARPDDALRGPQQFIDPQPAVPWTWRPGPDGRFDPYGLRTWRGGTDFDFDGSLLGVDTQPVSKSLAKRMGLESTDGAMIAHVRDGSAAEKAGLQPLDVIVAVDGDTVRSPAEFQTRILKAGPGANITIDVFRDAKKESVKVALADPFGANSARQAWQSRVGFYPWNPQTATQLEALEKRVKELEERVRELERRTAQPKPAPAGKEE